MKNFHSTIFSLAPTQALRAVAKRAQNHRIFKKNLTITFHTKNFTMYQFPDEKPLLEQTKLLFHRNNMYRRRTPSQIMSGRSIMFPPCCSSSNELLNLAPGDWNEPKWPLEIRHFVETNFLMEKKKFAFYVCCFYALNASLRS